jgi:hypothetical protein
VLIAPSIDLPEPIYLPSLCSLLNNVTGQPGIVLWVWASPGS